MYKSLNQNNTNMKMFTNGLVLLWGESGMKTSLGKKEWEREADGNESGQVFTKERSSYHAL